MPLRFRKGTASVRAGRPAVPDERKRGLRESRDLPGAVHIRHMRDKWIERRSALSLKYSGNGTSVPCVGTQAVDGLGRKCDEQSSREKFRRTGDSRLVGSKSLGFFGHVPLRHVLIATDRRRMQGCSALVNGTLP